MDLCEKLGFTRLQGKVISMPVSVERCLHFLERIGVHAPSTQPFVETLPTPETISREVAEPEPEFEQDWVVAAPTEPEISHTSITDLKEAPLPLAQSKGLTIFSLDFASNDEGDQSEAA
jgi:hypothetical protein